MGTTYTGLDLTKVAPFNSKFSILSVHLMNSSVKKEKIKSRHNSLEKNLLHLR